MFFTCFCCKQALKCTEIFFLWQNYTKKYHIFMLRLKLKIDFCNKFC